MVPCEKLLQPGREFIHPPDLHGQSNLMGTSHELSETDHFNCKCDATFRQHLTLLLPQISCPNWAPVLMYMEGPSLQPYTTFSPCSAGNMVRTWKGLSLWPDMFSPSSAWNVVRTWEGPRPRPVRHHGTHLALWCWGRKEEIWTHLNRSQGYQRDTCCTGMSCNTRKRTYRHDKDNRNK